MSDIDRYVRNLRDALVAPLSEGNWDEIQRSHAEIELEWRPDFEPGWGKPKYAKRVLDALADEQVISVARRTLEAYPERCDQHLRNTLLWIDANGHSSVSEITRQNLAVALGGRVLHPSWGPDQLLRRFSAGTPSLTFTQTADGVLYVREFVFFGAPTQPREVACTQLLEAYSFNEWPDATVFAFLELLVHPTVRRGREQKEYRDLINDALRADHHELVENGQISGQPTYSIQRTHAVTGRPKNLIFASSGPKPELGFRDAINNDVVVLKNAEHCLVFEESLTEGLTWDTLVEWWARRERQDPTSPATRKSLGRRLKESLASPPERFLFDHYFRCFRGTLGAALPALLPQVYLHYDPKTLAALRARGEKRRFEAQRMDFLLLLPYAARIVVEVDGQQHYSTGVEPSARPCPATYAHTVRGDRFLRLAGYEVYRIGGYELRDQRSARDTVSELFTRLFRRHGLIPH